MPRWSTASSWAQVGATSEPRFYGTRQRAYSRLSRCDTTLFALLFAGVIGLACARALALAGKEVVLTEAEAGVGTGTSSRHSEGEKRSCCGTRH